MRKMNEADATRNVSHISLLTYSTWLVLGIWLLSTGGRLIFKTADGDHSFLNYFLGAVRILIGLNAAAAAHSVARRADLPAGFSIRLLTYILVGLLVGLPLLLFVLQIAVAVFGTYQLGELYTENVTRLIFIAVCYLLATVYAGRKLSK